MTPASLARLEQRATPSPWPVVSLNSEGVSVGDDEVVAWFQPCSFTNGEHIHHITLEDCQYNARLVSALRFIAPEVIELIRQCQIHRPYMHDGEDALAAAIEAVESKLYSIKEIA